MLPDFAAFLSDRELYNKSTPLSRTFGFRLNRAAVGFDDLLRYVEAVAGRVHVDLDGILAAAAFGKEVRHVLRSDADPCVRHNDARHPTFFGERHRDAPRRRVLSLVFDDGPD